MNFFWDDGLVQEFFFLRIFTCRIFFFQNHQPPPPPPKVKWLAPKQRRSPKESGCLPFNQKIRKFRFEVKWKGNFPENIFGNCGQPPEVVLFFRSESAKCSYHLRESYRFQALSHKIACLYATIIPSGLFG